ncbi:MAG: hypothetical protein SO016_06040 [Lachnospiraceae bacterium]|nr:hypothetical protein [Lachnospiraceae bacterium]
MSSELGTSEIEASCTLPESDGEVICSPDSAGPDFSGVSDWEESEADSEAEPNPLLACLLDPEFCLDDEKASVWFWGVSSSEKFGLGMTSLSSEDWAGAEVSAWERALLSSAAIE